MTVPVKPLSILSAAVLILLAMLAALSASSARSQSFEGLGTLASHGGGGSSAHGVSDDGAVVAGYSSAGFSSDLPSQAIRWTGGVMTGLGSLREEYPSYAWAVSGDGSTVVGQSRSSGVAAFRWTTGGGMEQLDGCGTWCTKAFGVSANGAVVVGSYNDGRVGSATMAFRWTGGVSLLPSLREGARTEATAVSADGSVVVGVSDAQIALWQNGALTALGPGSAFGVSADGTIVVGATSVEGQRHAFIWTAAAGLVPLAGFPGSPNVTANDVSDAGEVIVGFAGTTGAAQLAAVWTPDGTVRLLKDVLENQGLDLTGWTLQNANGVSADGRVIVGYGINPDGKGEAYRAEILPIAAEEIVVTTTGDEPNDPISQTSDACDVDREEAGEQCTLRAAIELANKRGEATISFDIPGEGTPSIHVTEYEDETGPFERGLPPFEAPITLDGTTQPGGWVELVGDGVRGSRAGTPADAIRIGPGAGGSKVRGLVINRFVGSGIRLLPGADGCVIEGNRIGTDVTGTEAMGTPKVFFYDMDRIRGGDLLHLLTDENWPVAGGVRIGSGGNVVQDNVLAGNANRNDSDGSGFFMGGINVLLDRSAQGNVVRRNRIGVGADGRVLRVREPGDDTCCYTIYAGVIVQGTNNTIGGGEGEGNEIAGHNWDVLVRAPSGHVVAHNAIGQVPTEDLLPDHTVAALILSDRALTHGDPDAPHGRARVEGNRVRSRLAAAVVSGGYDVLGNTLHGRLNDSAEPPVGGYSQFHVEAAVSILGDDINFIGNEVRAPGWAVVVFSGRDVVLGQNDVEGGYGGVRVPYVPQEFCVWGWDADKSIDGYEVCLDWETTEPPSVLITRNRIVSPNLGIDLGGPYNGPYSESERRNLPDGVTLNDVTDLDDGPNGLLNYPVPLQVSRQEGDLKVEGELWGAYSGTYTVEAFANTTCSGASHAGRFYGAGEHYLGSLTVTPAAADLGAPAFSFGGGGLEEHHRFVTLTASRADLGVTSEFSPCVWVARAEDVARADVEPGKAGKIIDAVSVIVSITSAANGKTASSTALHDGGTIYATRYETAPDTSFFADTTATAPNGAAVRPEAVAARYWYLADRGLTAAGGAEDSTITFEVCLDLAGVVAPSSLEDVVLVQRSEATEGLWRPHDTYKSMQNGTTYLCAQNVTTLGEFGFGGAEVAFPVGIEDGDGGMSMDESERVPLKAFALGAAYPNPFSETTTIELTIPETGPVTVVLYDVLGRRVAVLVDDVRAAGLHRAVLDGASLPSGIYLVRMVAGGMAATQRVTVLR